MYYVDRVRASYCPFATLLAVENATDNGTMATVPPLHRGPGVDHSRFRVWLWLPVVQLRGFFSAGWRQLLADCKI